MSWNRACHLVANTGNWFAVCERDLRSFDDSAAMASAVTQYDEWTSQFLSLKFFLIELYQDVVRTRYILFRAMLSQL